MEPTYIPTNQPTTAADSFAQLNGGLTISVVRRLSPATDPVTEQVFVREVSIAEILDGQYVTLLREDYAKLLDWLLSKPDGWSRTLDRASWRLLRETEEQVNFDFALAETRAAHERGQRLRWLDELDLERTQKMMEALSSLTPSPSIAGSPAHPGAQPSPKHLRGSRPSYSPSGERLPAEPTT
jgi:hypothetical protein